MNQIQQVISQRILVLDGATGTMIQTFHLGEADFRGKRFTTIEGQLQGNNDLLCLTRPDVVEEIHRRYLEAALLNCVSFNGYFDLSIRYHLIFPISAIEILLSPLTSPSL